MLTPGQAQTVSPCRGSLARALPVWCCRNWTPPRMRQRQHSAGRTDVVPLAASHIDGRGEVSIMRIQHWQDAASLLVGVWLVLSPFALGFSGAAAGMTIALGLGVIL